MSSLLGAFAASGRPVRELLDEDAWRAMTPSGPGEERRDERLWIRAERLVETRGSLEAVEGFTTEGAGLEGHFVRAAGSSSRLALERSLCGGERLYYHRRGALVLFASSVNTLLRHPAIDARVHPHALGESLLTGLPMFGEQTLHEGVAEVPAGHTRTWDAQGARSELTDAELLTPREGDVETLGKEFRDALTEAVVRSAGSARPVAVALSGGIDSSAIAAAAVDAFGADGVEALTYEFGDPEHSTEREWATRVASHLGIRRHHFFSLDEDAYLDAIPEQVFRSESLVHWPKAFMLLVAREVKRRGFDRYLTGFGIGSHMGYLRALGQALERHPRVPLTTHWRAARFGRQSWPHRLQRLHPALEPPHPRLYYGLAQLLGRVGLRDPRALFTSALEPLLELAGARAEGPREGETLAAWLARWALGHLVSCIDVTRSVKASRELGVARIAPAHFPSTLPYAYLPFDTPQRLGADERALRPGKLLLRRGFRGAIPDEVLTRTKDWADAVASDRWLREGRRRMIAVLPSFPRDMARHGAALPGAIAAWEARSILASSLATRLFERMFFEMAPRESPPTWRDLWEARS